MNYFGIQFIKKYLNFIHNRGYLLFFRFLFYVKIFDFKMIIYYLFSSLIVVVVVIVCYSFIILFDLIDLKYIIYSLNILSFGVSFLLSGLFFDLFEYSKNIKVKLLQLLVLLIIYLFFMYYILNYFGLVVLVLSLS